MLKVPLKIVSLVALAVHALCHLVLRKSDRAHFSLTLDAGDDEGQ